MRLSEVLNKAPDTSTVQVENFLGYKKVGWGTHRNIKVGTVIRNYRCLTCRDTRTFSSGEIVSCLVTSDRSVSIDTTLRCPGCKISAEVWFLVGCDDDLFSPSPSVHLERFTENRRDAAASVGLRTEEIDDLFVRAQIAFDDHLGAGAMIYLRKIFELTTSQTAQATGIDAYGRRGGKKPFKELLKQVDTVSQIIPPEFSKNGYTLYSQLSEVIHGDFDEGEALSKYKPCRNLVFGIVNNVRNKQDMAQAIDALGWSEVTLLFADEGEPS